jgi:hypothetical protein
MCFAFPDDCVLRVSGELMVTSARIGSIACGIAALGIVLVCGSIHAAEPLPAVEHPEEAPAPSTTATVELLLRDGRRVDGELQARTDSRMVWIRTGSASITLDSGFAWDRVRGVRHDGRWLATAECQALIAHVKAVSSRTRSAAD